MESALIVAMLNSSWHRDGFLADVLFARSHRDVATSAVYASVPLFFAGFAMVSVYIAVILSKLYQADCRARKWRACN